VPFFGLFRDTPVVAGWCRRGCCQLRAKKPSFAVACWGNKIRGLRSGEDLALNDEQREAQLDFTVHEEAAVQAATDL
jgi:hypothetical protein